jgi:hypothetical protein
LAVIDSRFNALALLIGSTCTQSDADVDADADDWNDEVSEVDVDASE